MKEPTSVSMADKQMTKIKFATKLTLPRFIAVVERLTDKQQKLVRSMGFGHLLDLKCDTLPRGLAQWLAMRFNVKTRCLDLPNGLSINFNPFCIHQILGIPLGGRRINKKHSDAVRVLIAEETGCKGNYPTISELDELITTELDGDAFKRVFLQFALTSFLCPSSHDGASPDYYSALEVPDDIPKFDWCTIALDKLVLSIDNFQKEGATVLGGNLLSLVIFYDEFLDTTIMSDTVILPRLSVWTTQLVMEYEKMDCTSEDGLYYGRLPVKDISQTPFKMINSSPKTIPNIAHDEILEFVLSVVPEEKHEMVRDELPRIMDNFCKDLLCSMQDPTFLDNLCKALLSSIQPVVTQHMVSMFKLLLPARPVIADNNSKINDEKREIKDKRHIISSLPVDNPVLLQTTGRGKDVAAGTRTNCLIGPETDKLVRAKHDPMTPHESKAAPVTTEKILSNTSKQIGACMHPVHGKDKPMLLQITGHGKDVPAVTRTDCLIGPETDKLVGMNIVQRTPHESKVAPVTRDKNLSSTSEQIGDSMHAFQIPALKPDEEIAMSNEYSRPERRMNNVEKVDPLTCKKLDFPQVCSDFDLDFSGTMWVAPSRPEQLDNMTDHQNQKKRATCMSLNELCQAQIALKKAKMLCAEPSEMVPDATTTSHPLGGTVPHMDDPLDNVDVWSTVDKIEQEHCSIKQAMNNPDAKEKHCYSEKQQCIQIPQHALPIHKHEMTQHHCYSQKQPCIETPQPAQPIQNLEASMQHHRSQKQPLIQIGHPVQPIQKPESRQQHQVLQRMPCIQIPHPAPIENHEASGPVLQDTFVSSLVEKEMFDDIVNRIPFKGRSPKIVEIGTKWADHKTFGLNMRVYGWINKYTINLMGKAVMAELVEKERLDLHPKGYWTKYIFECDIAALFQKAYENPVGLSFHLSKRSTDRFLDKIDMVYLPLSASGFWYLIIANFRRRIFEVLCPIRKIELITDEAKSAIYSFQRAFRNAYPRSEINIFDMDQTFVTVSSSVKESDSGIFIMKLIQSHTGETDFFFRPEYAKAIREQLTFYLISHPCNVQLKPEAKRILAKYNIPYDYQTPGYYPWMPSSAM